jgi:hypothetical protein
LATERLPRGTHPRSGAILVLVQVSSMKTRRSGLDAILILCPPRPPPRDRNTAGRIVMRRFALRLGRRPYDKLNASNAPMARHAGTCSAKAGSQ